MIPLKTQVFLYNDHCIIEPGGLKASFKELDALLFFGALGEGVEFIRVELTVETEKPGQHGSSNRTN